ncbi:MAG: AAA family ATPase [Chloroflexota bacterium]|nr:AAA family ATPase [Chloroflexota bacterium]
MQDVPGKGKGILAQALARVLGCALTRIGFTPDLTPATCEGWASPITAWGRWWFSRDPSSPKPIPAGTVLSLTWPYSC